MALAVLMNLLFLTGPLVAASAAGANGNANAAHLCQQRGYLALVGVGGETFANTGQCVSYAARGGTFATGLIIPAGAQATLSQVSFGGACDPLTYGYQVNSGPLVAVDSKPFGCPYTAPVAGTTIGPFPTAVVLRIFLEDNFCGGGPNWTYYSDGNHALVTPVAPGVYLVDIMDSAFCSVPSTSPRSPSGPGSGDLRLTLSIN